MAYKEDLIRRLTHEAKELRIGLEKAYQVLGPSYKVDELKTFAGEDWSDLTATEKAARIELAAGRFRSIQQELESLGADPWKGKGFVHPFGGGSSAPDTGDDLGALLKASDFSGWVARGAPASWSEEFADARPSKVFGFGANRKALFERTAGWSPESVRIPGVVPAVTRPLSVVDIVPVRNAPISDQISYMEETTRTHAASERAEAAAYPESDFVLTERQRPIQKISDSVPVTDEQLADVPSSESYLVERLGFGVRQRLDWAVINGGGVAPNLLGVLNTAGIQTQARGALAHFDAVHMGITLVQTNGRAQPSAIVINPTNWETIRLLTSADGHYLMGSPSERGPLSLWGLPVVVTDVIAAGTALIGDFLNFSALYERQGIAIEVGYTGDQFTRGLRTLRAQGRWCFVVTRAAAFATVTGL